MAFIPPWYRDSEFQQAITKDVLRAPVRLALALGVVTLFFAGIALLEA